MQNAKPALIIGPKLERVKACALAIQATSLRIFVIARSFAPTLRNGYNQ
jgi:hypothetical protein